MSVEIDQYGRVLIPKSVRDRLGFEPGSELELTVEGSRLTVEVRDEQPRVRDEDGVLVYTGEAEGGLDETLERVRSDRLEDLASS